MGTKLYIDLNHWGLPFGYSCIDDEFGKVHFFAFLCLVLAIGDVDEFT